MPTFSVPLFSVLPDIFYLNLNEALSLERLPIAPVLVAGDSGASRSFLIIITILC